MNEIQTKDLARLEHKVEKYKKNYSEASLLEKALRYAKKAGIRVIYAVMLLYFVLQKPDVPVKVKGIIVGSLGYFILPLDLLPDWFPGVGYTDDFSLLIAAIAVASMYIDRDVREKARNKLYDWFGEISPELLQEIDKRFE